MASGAGQRREVAPHLCKPGTPDNRTGDVLCVVCGAVVDTMYWPGPSPRANAPRMLDELRSNETTFTATFRFRTGSLMPDEVPILVEVGREIRMIRKRRRPTAPRQIEGRLS